jgi:hypothetical protein
MMGFDVFMYYQEDIKKKKSHCLRTIRSLERMTETVAWRGANANIPYTAASQQGEAIII